MPTDRGWEEEKGRGDMAGPGVVRGIPSNTGAREQVPVPGWDFFFFY